MATRITFKRLAYGFATFTRSAFGKAVFGGVDVVSSGRLLRDRHGNIIKDRHGAALFGRAVTDAASAIGSVCTEVAAFTRLNYGKAALSRLCYGLAAFGGVKTFSPDLFLRDRHGDILRDRHGAAIFSRPWPDFIRASSVGTLASSDLVLASRE